MKINEWVKIGEVERLAPILIPGTYARYAVMELIKTDGMRKYKEVFMCSWYDKITVSSQPQVL